MDRMHRHGHTVIDKHDTGEKEKNTQFTNRKEVYNRTPTPALGTRNKLYRVKS